MKLDVDHLTPIYKRQKFACPIFMIALTEVDLQMRLCLKKSKLISTLDGTK